MNKENQNETSCVIVIPEITLQGGVDIESDDDQFSDDIAQGGAGAEQNHDDIDDNDGQDDLRNYQLAQDRLTRSVHLKFG